MVGAWGEAAPGSLHVALCFPAFHRRGGVERVVWEAAAHLSGRNRMTVVCGEADPSPPEIEVVRVPGAPFTGSLAPRQFRQAAAPVLRSVGADVTVSFGSDCPDADVLVMQSVHRTWVSGGSAVRVGPVKVPPWVRRVLPRHRVRLTLERAALRSLTARDGSRVVAVSDNVRDDLVRWYGVPRATIDVVANGFDPQQCSPERSADIRDDVRKELGLEPRHVVLLFVANEYHRKGLAVLLQAMADASVRSPDLRLLLVGRMAPDAYAEQIRSLQLDEQVRWVGAADDVGRYYAAGDLFVLPTSYEAFGSVIVEALASGLPVITTERAGAAVTVHPGENGLLLRDPGSADELAGLLATALQPGTLERWREHCRPAVDGYEWSQLMERFEEILAGVARSRPSAGR